MKTVSTVRFAAVAALGLVAASAYGQVLVTGDATFTAGPANFTFGYRFDVTGGSNIKIAALGVFDPTGTGPTAPVQIRIWNAVSHLLVAIQTFSPGINPGSFSSGNYQWITLAAPVTLNAGSRYVLTEWSATSQAIGSFPTTTAPATPATLNGAALGVTYVADFWGAGNAFPTSYSLPPSTFKGPNMMVPEPETYAFVAGLGLVGYGLYRRRQEVRG